MSRARGTSRALRAEWTKLRTMPSTVWLLLATVAVTVAVGGAAAESVQVSQCPSPAECFEDTTKLALTGVWPAQAIVAVLAALAITNEYGTNLIRATLVTDPRRVRVLAAKAVVAAAVVLVAGVAGVLGSLAAAREILPGNGFAPPSLGAGPTLRAAAGTVLYLGLIALIGLGVGAAVRDTAGAVTALLGLLFLAPLATQFVTHPVWQRRLERFTPTSAGMAVQATIGLDRLPIGPWAGLGVLAAYAAGALLLGAVLFAVRDA